MFVGADRVEEDRVGHLGLHVEVALADGDVGGGQPVSTKAGDGDEGDSLGASGEFLEDEWRGLAAGCGAIQGWLFRCSDVPS